VEVVASVAPDVRDLHIGLVILANCHDRNRFAGAQQSALIGRSQEINKGESLAWKM
jgi:hypothetical protein